MSLPEPMLCHLDRCRSPLACNDYGRCREAAKDSAKSYDEAIRECRERGLKPWQGGKPG